MGGKRVIEAGFVARLTEAHKGKLQYLFGFSGMNENVHVICFDCGKNWWGVACNLVAKNKPKGCPVCADKSRSLKKTKTTEQYIMELYSVHGDRYRPVGDYLGAMTKNPHLCTQCNETWDVKPTNLLSGRGCPICADTCFDPNKPAITVLIHI